MSAIAPAQRSERDAPGSGKHRAAAAGARSEKRDWSRNRAMWVRLLETRTGEGLDVWVRRVKRSRLGDPESLREWLSVRGVTGYAQTLLVMERFGYPDFLRATADELIDRQYADRPALRPIYDAVVAAARSAGETVIQARKTYVSLVGPRRTYARIQPTTRERVDVALRLEGFAPGGRLQRSRIHATMPVQICLRSSEELDAEAVQWLRRAYEQNARPGGPKG